MLLKKFHCSYRFTSFDRDFLRLKNLWEELYNELSKKEFEMAGELIDVWK
jgi:hypothetical protein